MPASHEEAIARRLAAQFAPVLGGELPALTERVLSDEPADETPFRSGDPSAVMGYAAFIVALSTLAWNAYLRLSLGREVAALQNEMAALKGVMVAELHRAAPPDRRLAEPVRGLLVNAAADLALAEGAGSQQRSAGAPAEPERAGPVLRHDEILELHRAVVSAQLTGSRAALLVGIDAAFVAALPSAASPSDQILCDLGALNAAGGLADRSVPLAIWLANALTLAGVRKEAAVFRAARARLDGVE